MREYHELAGKFFFAQLNLFPFQIQLKLAILRTEDDSFQVFSYHLLGVTEWSQETIPKSHQRESLEEEREKGEG